MMFMFTNRLRILLLLAMLLGIFAGVGLMSSAQGGNATATPAPSATVITPAITSPATLTPSADAQAATATAEASCPVLVREAIDRTQGSCAMIGNNQVCYGNNDLQAAARPGVEDFSFEVPGDIEEVITMQSLSLSAFNAAQEVWGVVMMRVQASLDVEDQNDVTFVVFGDTELQSSLPLVEVRTAEDVRLRNGPSVDSEPLDVIPQNETIVANGRTETGEWLRVLIPNSTTARNGWVFAELVTPSGDLETLNVVGADDEDDRVRYGPMQAFYFQSGKDDAPCPEAPNSGMLIQTPEGEASVTLLIDEVIIELDATAFIQAQPNGELNVYALEGQARVTAMGETRTAVAGQQISVALDEDLGAVEAPADATAYDLDDLQGLPTTLLPDQIEIAEPLELGPGVPTPGNWAFAWGVSEMACPDSTVFNFESSGTPGAIQVADGGAAIIWGGGTYTRTSDGVYTRAYIDVNSNLIQDTMVVNSPDSISGEAVIDVATTVCTLTVPFSLQLVSAFAP